MCTHLCLVFCTAVLLSPLANADIPRTASGHPDLNSTYNVAAGEKVFRYACHEGNYALGGILRGARVLEAEALAKSSGDESAE